VTEPAGTVLLPRSWSFMRQVPGGYSNALVVKSLGSTAIVEVVSIRVRIAIAASFPYDIFIFQVFACSSVLAICRIYRLVTQMPGKSGRFVSVG
jgi:hypothetical protein